MSILGDMRGRRKAARPSANGQPADPAAGGELVLRPLSEFRARPVRYLVPRTIPVGKVTMLAGVGGMGKSTIMRHLIARLTSGRPAFGMDYPAAEPCEVMLASVEDSPQDTILPHLAAEGADLDRVLVEDGVRKAGWKPGDRAAPFDLRDLHLVMASFAKRPAIRLMVIDPIGSYVARSGANENSSGEVRALLDPLHDLADRTGVAVILIAHLNKANNVAAVNRIVGTAAFRDTCRVVYVLGHDPNDHDRRVMAVAKENVPGLDCQGLAFRRVPLGPAEAGAVLATRQMDGLTAQEQEDMAVQLARVEPGGRVDITADQALGTGKKPGERPSTSAQAECAEWVRNRLGTEFSWLDREIEKEAMEYGRDRGWDVFVYRRAKKTIPGYAYRKYGFGADQYYRIAIGNVAEMAHGEFQKRAQHAQHAQPGEANGHLAKPVERTEGEIDGPGWPADAPP